LPAYIPRHSILPKINKRRSNQKISNHNKVFKTLHCRIKKKQKKTKQNKKSAWMADMIVLKIDKLFSFVKKMFYQVKIILLRSSSQSFGSDLCEQVKTAVRGAGCTTDISKLRSPSPLRNDTFASFKSNTPVAFESHLN